MTGHHCSVGKYKAILSFCCLAVGLQACSTPTDPPAASTSPSAREIEGKSSAPDIFVSTEVATKEIDSLLDAGDIEAAKEAVSKYVSQPGRTPEDTSFLYGEIVFHAARQRDTNLYKEYLGHAIAADPARGHYFSAYYVTWASDTKQSVESTVWLTKHQPDYLHGLKIEKIWAVYRELRDQERDDDIFAMLLTLYESEYQGDDEAGTTEYLTLELVKRLLKRGEDQRAMAIALMELRLVPVLMSLWHDRDFEPLWAPLDALDKFNIKSMLDGDLAENFQAQERSTNLGFRQFLRASLQVAQSLRQSGKSDVAEAYIDQVFEVLPDEQKKLQNYMWLKNELAYALDDQDKVDEALALMQEFTQPDISKNGHLINQWINYATMLRNARRYRTALDITGDILSTKRQYMSPYGLYWTLAIRACSFAGIREFEQAEELFAEMAAKPEENYSAISMAGLCLEKYDTLSELYVSRLNSKLYRTEALLALSTYPLPDLATENAELQYRLNRIRNRDDVKAAITTAGRVNDWPFPSIYWGDY